MIYSQEVEVYLSDFIIKHLKRRPHMKKLLLSPFRFQENLSISETLRDKAKVIIKHLREVGV